jgi:hypothetical protein
LVGLYEVAGATAKASRAFGDVALIIQGLAQGLIADALRERSLSGPQAQPVLRQVQPYVSALWPLGS